MVLDPRLVEILACPEDKGPLLYFEADGFLYNPRLRRRYEIDDGIPIMLIDEATTLDADGHDEVMQRAAEAGIEENFAP
ncbi:MAG: Trm112 family protein [bacterium]|nr:Trm112 family protein [bacterium]